jgi:putative membrane protein
MMWDWHGYSWWWFVAMPLGMLGFWALVAWAVVTVMRGTRTTPPATAPAEAERILAERYARGDIDPAEYHARLDDLRRTGATSGDAR